MKLGNLYNLPKFQKFADSAKVRGFTDAESGLVIAENLKHIDPQIFEKKYPELAGMNLGLTVDNTGGYSRTIQSLRIQSLGGFSTAGADADNSGRISLAGEDTIIKVFERKAHSNWSESDIKEAELQNINLPQRYVASADMLYKRDIDQIILGSQDDARINPGIFNYTGWSSEPSSDLIGNLTAQQQYDIIAELITDQHNGVNNTPEYMANKVLLPIPVINTLKTTILNSAGSTKSVLRSLQDNFAGIDFGASFRGNAGEAASESRVAAFSTNSEALKLRIPVPLQVGEIIKLGSFDYHIDYMYRIAGVDFLEDTAGRILTGL